MKRTKFWLLAAVSVMTMGGARTASAEDLVWRHGEPVTLCCDTARMEPVVSTAVLILERDVQNVLGASLSCSAKVGPTTAAPIIRTVIDQGACPREGFRIEASERTLTVTASDGHGLAYGLLELSRLMGVSPWEWWADVTPEPLEEWRVAEDFRTEQAPDVAFRGIFINDEDWGLMPWSSMTYEPTGVRGSIGPRTYARVFELLLRLRANTIWPAMHECSQPFFLTQGNREVAARYGIYMGGSHCEPMACSAAVEWGRRGVGDYDYVNNAAGVRRFWESRLQEVRDQEVLYTIGMRGVHDGAMQGAKTVEEQKQVLTRVIHDQREMLTKYLVEGTHDLTALPGSSPSRGTRGGLHDLTEVPQVFIPYKEVLDVYNAGLEVPDDVCLMWCDDNYGYIRHFPTTEERARQGGNGIYYHVSYWGRPHDYLWLGTQSPALLMQQMSLAFDKGIQKIWILNVGDIKPEEYQIELFLDMAWDINEVRQLGLKGHQRRFYEREFGAEVGSDIQQMMQEWWRLAYIHKPEFMAGTRVEEAERTYWYTVRDLPWSTSVIDQRLHDYQLLSDRAERIAPHISEGRRDAYYELVKYPVQACDQMNRKLMLAQLARHAKDAASADRLWNESDAAFDSIASLTRVYNMGIANGGKWNRMMDMSPRVLPDFMKVKREASDATRAYEPAAPDTYLKHWDGIDATSGRYVRCEGLGYHEGAILLMPGEAVDYVLPCATADSVTVELHLLPSHAVDGKHQVILVNNTPVDFRTEGRSEEWKENVLWNQSIRRLTLPCQRGHRFVITLSTECEGVVVDEVLCR